MACAYKTIRKAIKKIKLQQKKLGNRAKITYPDGINPALDAHRKSGRTMYADYLLDNAMQKKSKSLTDKQKIENKKFKKEQAQKNRLYNLFLED